jgi:ubiquinone/menaquinone biosynthesis C-methylase UbiE
MTHWTPSYLLAFDPFINDPRSKEDACALVDKHLAETPAGRQHSFSLLDVCCGTGLMGRAVEAHLQSLGKHVETTFLDKSGTILEDIEVMPTDGFIVSSVTSMNRVPSRSYDIVVCRYGFNNLPQEDWLKALVEVLRVLKPGGIFLLQDHFVPGPTFSALVNAAEQFLAKMEGKEVVPFIYSTEVFNDILDAHPQVVSRVKTAHELKVNIWDRLKAKCESITDFDAAKRAILRFYEEVCLKKFQVLIVRQDEYIVVYNITYGIVKRG